MTEPEILEPITRTCATCGDEMTYDCFPRTDVAESCLDCTAKRSRPMDAVRARASQVAAIFRGEENAVLTLRLAAAELERERGGA